MKNKMILVFVIITIFTGGAYLTAVSLGFNDFSFLNIVNIFKILSLNLLISYIYNSSEINNTEINSTKIN